jgi:bifunctional non-homologous end joining protein LigD
MKSTVLYFSDLAVGGTSDKEYRIQLSKKGAGYVVNFQFGRRGGSLQTGTKTTTPVSQLEAEIIYDRLMREKVGKGYNEGKVIAGSAPVAPVAAPVGSSSYTRFPVELLEEITRPVADAYIKAPGYWLQVKVDGHRRQMEKNPDGSITSYNRKGQATSLPSEVADELKGLLAKTFLMDGELVGNSFVAFDLLTVNGVDITKMPYQERFDTLEKLMPKGAFTTVVATWKTTEEKTDGLAALESIRAEGVVFKRTDAFYRAGRNGVHKKFKFVKSCTCKVVGLKRNGHNSATLALNSGKGWIEVGGVSLNGKDARIKVGSLVEVLFLYATKGKQLYQPRIKELRTDVDESACSIDQLKDSYKEGVEV